MFRPVPLLQKFLHAYFIVSTFLFEYVTHGQAPPRKPSDKPMEISLNRIFLENICIPYTLTQRRSSGGNDRELSRPVWR